MGCLECKVFFCENSGEWKLKITRKIGLDHVRPGYQVLGFERVVMETGDVKILGHGDLIFPGSLEDMYRIEMNPPLTRIKPKSSPRRVERNFLYVNY